MAEVYLFVYKEKWDATFMQIHVLSIKGKNGKQLMERFK